MLKIFLYKSPISKQLNLRAGFLFFCIGNFGISQFEYSLHF
ncbi:hypothetical protein BMWSH_3546 [Priestia megaterium WSH-002]|uniref:Uncharacterized protein n=1 Tax=Priestia megaterium (strain WSH-002) TaxID=1006007 RepID=A0A8D4BL16_PRIMW|nr:hypothetical protein BMWSH_3546 [Priestia megaterium WSH-002]